MRNCALKYELYIPSEDNYGFFPRFLLIVNEMRMISEVYLAVLSKFDENVFCNMKNNMFFGQF